MRLTVFASCFNCIVCQKLSSETVGGVAFLSMCSPEIAASFAKGVHFNTFGGNPVACTVASSVLDVSTFNLFHQSYASA